MSVWCTVSTLMTGVSYCGCMVYHMVHVGGCMYIMGMNCIFVYFMAV